MATPPKKQNILTASQIIDRGTDTFVDGVKGMEGAFVRRLLDEVKRLDTKADNTVSDTKKNRSIIGELRSRIKKIMRRVGFDDLTTNYLTNFDELQTFQQFIHKRENDIKLTKSFLNPFKKFAIDKVVFDMQGQGLNVGLIKPIQDQLTQAVKLGGNLVDVIKGLEDNLASSPQRLGLFSRYLTQVSRDALGQYDGLVNERIAERFELDTWRYVGSLVKDSRAQCVRWVGMGEIPFSQVQKEINWANRNGKGMIPNTTPANFGQNRGGYNCRHTAIPVRSKKKD
jgi:hypothetical protein